MLLNKTNVTIWFVYLSCVDGQSTTNHDTTACEGAQVWSSLVNSILAFLPSSGTVCAVFVVLPTVTLDVPSKLEHWLCTVSDFFAVEQSVRGPQRTEGFREPRLPVYHRPSTREKQRAVSKIPLIVSLLSAQMERIGITEIVVAKKKNQIRDHSSYNMCSVIQHTELYLLLINWFLCIGRKIRELKAETEMKCWLPIAKSV
jgi:hypothetical protein